MGESAERAVPSKALLSDACDIIRRLVAVVNYNNEYDEHECPNGEPPCACCKLVTRAKQFITDNAGSDASASSPIASTGLVGQEG